MTEERFEAAVERMGDAIERAAEGAADRLERSVNRAWGFRPVRFVGKTLSFLTGAGLIAGALPLAEQGRHTAAKVCLIGGGLVIAGGLLELALFRRK